MTRRFAKLTAVYLLLGLVATVAVAWALELIPPTPDRVHQELADEWLYPAPPEFWLEAAREQQAIGRSRRFAWGFPFLERRYLDEYAQAEFRTGLPLHSMSRRASYRGRGGVITLDEDVDALRAGLKTTRKRVDPTRWESCRLPLTPYWPGLLADIAFYAMIFAGLHQLATWGRRARRRKRGNCAACGYDLTGLNSATCPECSHQC